MTINTRPWPRDKYPGGKIERPDPKAMDADDLRMWRQEQDRRRRARQYSESSADTGRTLDMMPGGRVGEISGYLEDNRPALMTYDAATGRYRMRSVSEILATPVKDVYAAEPVVRQQKHSPNAPTRRITQSGNRHVGGK